MTERWVVLEPLDTVTIRDGRAFDMGQDSVAHLTLPSPATFAGAIGSMPLGLPDGHGAAPQLLSVASPLGLFAEEFDTSTGRHLGNFPQAFSHLALIEAAGRIILAERVSEI